MVTFSSCYYVWAFLFLEDRKLSLTEAKPFKKYSELVDILTDHGMVIEDRVRAERKLSQVGYYRLSGFWYPCRPFDLDKEGNAIKQFGRPKRLSNFLEATTFNNIFQLYLFDKRIRLLLLDAIERIEINLKTILAHEVGQLDPLAYQKPDFINPEQLKDYYSHGQVKNTWTEWVNRQRGELSRSKEECITWHTKAKKEIPIWVAIETWSFGTVSKYFEMLKRTHQNAIAQKLGVSNTSYLIRWLQEINILRNRCAHHTRVWNQTFYNPVNIPTDLIKDDTKYFANFDLNENGRKNIYAIIIIIWYLVRRIGPNSAWITEIIEEIEQAMTLTLPFDLCAAMGIPDDGLNIDKFCCP